jgi:hypothetical protein
MNSTDKENEMTTTECPGCEWGDEIAEHQHNDAEDGPRETCCEHNCK